MIDKTCSMDPRPESLDQIIEGAPINWCKKFQGS